MKLQASPLKLLGSWFVLILGLFFSTTLYAASDDGATVQSSSKNEAQVNFVRDKNYACTQCHKDEESQLDGAHKNEINSKTQRHVGCIDCHQKIGPKHRDGAKDVTHFKAGQTKAGTEKPAHDKAWIAKQNKQCTECHTGDQLRKAEWTHDVHVQKLTCASCHKIHPSQDPMKDIKHDNRVQKCIDCHGDQTQYKAQHQKESVSNKASEHDSADQGGQ